MHLPRQDRWSGVLLLLGAGLAQGCTIGQQRAAAVAPAASPLIVARADDGFVIRAVAPRVTEPVKPVDPAPSGFVPIGSDIHFDLRALVPIQKKETPNGETR